MQPVRLAISARPAARCKLPLYWLALSALLAAGALLPRTALAAEEALPVAKVSYFRDVWPVFQVNCQGCHHPGAAKGEYVMTSFDKLLAGGESSEKAIVAGKPEASHLLAQIVPKDGKADMPKGKPPLADREIDLIRRWIAEGAVDDTPAAARQVIDQQHPPVYQLPPVLTAIDFSPTGDLLAVSGYHEVLLHKADGSGMVARLVGLSERIESVAFSPDGKLLAVAGGSPCRFGEVQIWDVGAAKQVLSVSFTYDTLFGVSWSHDGTKVAFGCADNSVRAIDAKTGEQVLFQGAHADFVQGTAFSSTGSHLVSVSRDQSMKLVEVATQRFVDNITSITPGALKGGLRSIQRHPKKDEVVVGGADGAPKIYKIFRDAGQQRKIGDDFNLIRAFPALPGRVYAVRYSPDGERIAAGSSLDGAGEVRVYNAADGKEAAKFQGQPGPVYAIAFSADGAKLAVAGFQGKVLIMDAATGKLIKEFVPVEVAGEKVVGK